MTGAPSAQAETERRAQAREDDHGRGKSLVGALCQSGGSWGVAEYSCSQSGLREGYGHKTSNSTVYNLLARHGWRKLMPRPFHPVCNLAAQNALKKNPLS
jgi:hypothetical protein